MSERYLIGGSGVSQRYLSGRDLDGGSNLSSSSHSVSKSDRNLDGGSNVSGGSGTSKRDLSGGRLDGGSNVSRRNLRCC